MFEFIDDPSDPPQAKTQQTPGQVRFDDRGNAIYAWRYRQLEMDGKQGEKLRERALLNPTLSLVDDRGASGTASIANPKGLRLGYNPYQSGQLAGQKPVAKKCDIRELSKWIEMKRRMDTQHNGSTKK